MPLPPTSITVAPAAAGQRLDKYLATQLAGWSRVQVQAAIRGGGVSVAGAPALRPSQPVVAGAAIAIHALPTVRDVAPLQPEPIPLQVLYEDADLAVIDKPAGLVVHPGAGRPRGTLVHALLHRFAGLSQAGGDRPGIVHRLDRLTSGVLVIARTDAAHRHLAAQFAARTVRKRYLALVHGVPRRRQGEVTAPIHRDRRHRLRMTARRRDGRPACTRYRVRELWMPSGQLRGPEYALLDVDLLTGRTHQIRVHMAALGHPVAGDRLYGAPAVWTGPGDLAGFRPPRVYLHAAGLALDHPRTGARMVFRSPLPPEFLHLWDTLRAAGWRRETLTI